MYKIESYCIKYSLCNRSSCDILAFLDFVKDKNDINLTSKNIKTLQIVLYTNNIYSRIE